MVKRVLSTLTVITMIMANTSIMPAAVFAESSEIAVWQATGASGGGGTNISGCYEGETETTIYYDPNAKKLLPGDIYWYDLSDDVTAVEFPATVTVDYYDAEAGRFAMEYQLYSFDTAALKTTQTEEVVCEGTATWKSYTFELENPLFGNSFSYSNNGTKYADFNIKNVGADTDGSVYVGKVTVNKTYDYPITFVYKNTYASNVYKSDNQSLSVEFKNPNANAADAVIEAKVYKRDWKAEMQQGTKDAVVWNEKEEWKQTDTLTLSSGEAQTITYYPNMSVYGIYRLDVSLTSGEYQRTQSVEFSVINSAEGVKNDRMNINQEYERPDDKYTEYYDDKLYLCEQAGFGAYRMGDYWHYVDRRGSDEMSIPYPYSPVYPNNLATGKLDATYTLGYGNYKYYENNDLIPDKVKKEVAVFPVGEEAEEAFLNYVRFVVNEYATKAPGKVKYYALWNEFNGAGFNKGGATYQQYAQMLKRVYPIVKDIDPNAEVIAFVTAMGEGTGMNVTSTSEDYSYIEAVLEEGTYDYFDVISVHPYCFLGNDRHYKLVEGVRAVLDRYKPEGAEDKKIYYTECGYPTSLISEVGQANYAVKFYAESQAINPGSKLWWYDLMDKDDEHRDVAVDHEPHFGLTNNPRFGGYAKLSYVSMSGMNKFMYDAEYEKKLTDSDEVSAYAFKKSNYENIAVVWSNKKNVTKSVELDLQSDTIEVYDVFTNHIAHMTSENGVYNIEVNDSPVYIKYSVPAVSEDEKLTFAVSDGTSITEKEKPKYLYSVTNKGEKLSGILKAYTATGTVLYENSISIPPRTEINSIISVENPGVGDYEITFELTTDSGETLHFMKALSVTSAPDKSTFRVTFNDDILTAVINTTPNTYTAVYVTDENGKIIYLNQGMSNENGVSEISGSFPYRGLFNVRVYTGTKASDASVTADGTGFKYGIKRVNPQTGEAEPVTDLSDISDGDSIILEGTYYNYNDNEADVNIYSAIYDADNRLENFHVGPINGYGRISYNITIDKASDVNKWTVFIWNSNLTPIEKPVIILKK